MLNNNIYRHARSSLIEVIIFYLKPRILVLSESKWHWLLCKTNKSNSCCLMQCPGEPSSIEMRLNISGARYNFSEGGVRWLFRTNHVNVHNSQISRPFPLSLFVTCRNETTILNAPLSSIFLPSLFVTDVFVIMFFVIAEMLLKWR